MLNVVLVGKLTSHASAKKPAVGAPYTDLTVMTITPTEAGFNKPLVETHAIRAYNLLGDLAYKRADNATAATDYEHAENIARTRFGKQNVFSAVYLSNLGKAHLKLNEAQLAESEEREAVQYFKTLPPGSLLLGTALARWGRSLLATGDYQKAEEQLTAAKQLLATQPNASKDDLQSVEEDLSKIPQSTNNNR